MHVTTDPDVAALVVPVPPQGHTQFHCPWCSVAQHRSVRSLDDAPDVYTPIPVLQTRSATTLHWHWHVDVKKGVAGLAASFGGIACGQCGKAFTFQVIRTDTLRAMPSTA